MYKPEKLSIGENSILRYDLNHKLAPRDLIVNLITPLWREYEEVSCQKELFNSISQKLGRSIDIVYNRHGTVCAFYIFRMFKFANWNVMFRGNSYSSPKTRSLGAHLIKISLKQLKPDRIVTFTPQRRSYAFLKHFGIILPSNDQKISYDEFRLLSLLAGEKYVIDPETLLIRNFYHHPHYQIGRPLRDHSINNLFAKLNKYDTYGVIIRCD